MKHDPPLMEARLADSGRVRVSVERVYVPLVPGYNGPSGRIVIVRLNGHVTPVIWKRTVWKVPSPIRPDVTHCEVLIEPACLTQSHMTLGDL